MRLQKSLATLCCVLTSLVFISAGCVRQTSSGVIDRGANTYYVSVKTISMYGGRQESLRAAYKEAREYCQQQRKELTVIDEKSGPATVNLTFKCISPGESEPSRQAN